jgi:hypothetical protein
MSASPPDVKSLFGRALEVAVAATTGYEAIAERPGTLVGPYKLMEQIGEGAWAWCSSLSSSNQSAARWR